MQMHYSNFAIATSSHTCQVWRSKTQRPATPAIANLPLYKEQRIMFISLLLLCTQIIFKNAAQDTGLRKYLSLFPGIGWGGTYKILQRVYKFGGQVCTMVRC